jgi:alpha-tubulin suppressor-like RCC1 family protein
MLYQIAAGPFHTIMLTTEGNLLSMGNSKDGKLGYHLQAGNVVDAEEPQRILCGSVPKGTQFFCNTQVATIIKQYPLFDDYDEFSKLRSLYAKDDPYEINQIVCGDNF